MVLRKQMPPGLAALGRRRTAAEARSGTEEVAPRQGSHITRCGCLSSPTRAGGRPLVWEGTMTAGGGVPAPDAGLWTRGSAWGAGRSADSPFFARERL